VTPTQHTIGKTIANNIIDHPMEVAAAAEEE
jgi:hypothetical protein